jgi:hypothetical protein
MLTTIPIEVCLFVLKYRIVNPFRSYLILKYHYSGKAPLNKKQLSNVTGISVKTLDKHLLELRKINWIGFNPNSNILFIRGLDNIRKMHQFKSSFSIVCREQHLKLLRPFLYAAVLSYIIRNKKRKAWKQCASKNGNANQHCSTPFSYPIANSYMAKLINCSISEAVKLKSKAEAAGYIETKENIQATNVSILNYESYKRPTNPDNERIRRFGSKIGIQQPDLIKSNMNFSRRKKLEGRKV